MRSHIYKLSLTAASNVLRNATLGIADVDNLTPSGSAPKPPEQDLPLEAARSSPPKEKDDHLAADNTTSLRTPSKPPQTSPKAPSSRQIFKTPDAPSSKSHSSEIALTEWFFKREYVYLQYICLCAPISVEAVLLRSAGSRNIIVEGRAPGEAKRWHTSALDARLSDRRVRTKSGSVYRLVGPANVEAMAGGA